MYPSEISRTVSDIYNLKTFLKVPGGLKKMRYRLYMDIPITPFYISNIDYKYLVNVKIIMILKKIEILLYVKFKL